MNQPSTSLRIFLYHPNGNSPAVRALYSRLIADGVSVRLLEDVGQIRSREFAIRDAVSECNVVLVALSGDVVVAPSEEIDLVVSMTTQKQQGELFVLPVRFEQCEVPDSLKRWQAVDLFEEDGYEKLMLALKLRAERLGSVLVPRPEWNVPLRWDGKDIPVGSPIEEERPDISVSLLIGIAAVLLIAVLVLFGFSGMFRQAIQTDVPPQAMVENSTQNALEQVKNRHMSQTAIVLTVSAPITQTAAMEETLQHPATSTLQFPTIMALPTEIIDPGNIRMVYVPGDNFVIGGEGDVHSVYVNPFYIDKFEVTNVLYQVCVSVGSCEPPIIVSSQTHPAYYGNVEFNDYPVLNVTWDMARQYCEWRGARLPTEAEWEKAARSVDGRTYPWGEDVACSFANYSDASGACVGDTTAVGTYKDGQSLYGAFDMAGNVSEWVNSLYWIYPYSANDGRESTDTPGLRVVRGGSWYSPLEEITTYYRSGVDPSTHDGHTGFRCAHGAKL